MLQAIVSIYVCVCACEFRLWPAILLLHLQENSRFFSYSYRAVVKKRNTSNIEDCIYKMELRNSLWHSASVLHTHTHTLPRTTVLRSHSQSASPGIILRLWYSIEARFTTSYVFKQENERNNEEYESDADYYYYHKCKQNFHLHSKKLYSSSYQK